MDAIKSALQAKRMQASGAHLPSQGEHKAPVGHADVKAIYQSLSPEQKDQMKSLVNGGDKVKAQIEKGDPSDNERAAIEAKISDDSQADMANEAAEGHDSDDIAMGMLDSKSKANALQPGAEPRNLGERVRMNLAGKLKAKGKI